MSGQDWYLVTPYLS